MRNRISIWGTGSVGKRMYAYLKIRTEIVCFYDNNENKAGQFLEGVPVKQWIPAESSEFIVIASSFYEEIIPLLIQEGLTIFKDFTLYTFIENPFLSEYKMLYRLQKCMGGWQREDWIRYKGEKEIVVIHGGCHAEGLGNLLALHTQFREKYKIVITPHIMSLLPTQDKMTHEIAEYYMRDDNFLGAIDIFFYQLSHIWPKFIDPHTLMSKLSVDCKKYALSSLEFFGYFPQCRHRLYKFFCSCTDLNLVYALTYADHNIEKLYCERKNADEISRILEDEEFLQEDEVTEFFRVSLSLLQMAEDGVEIKINDYIEKYGKTSQLFTDPGHPTQELLMEYANRIIRFLIPDSILMQENDYRRAFQDVYPTRAAVLIYPCVRKALGLKNFYEKVYIVRGVPLTMKEYIHEYVRILAYNEAQEKSQRE